MITIKRNDLEPPCKVKLLLDGAPVDLNGASVKFLLKADGAMSASPPKVSATATIVDAAGGVVQYDWAGTDTDTVGNYKAEFEVTFANGKPRTFPGADYLLVRIVADLG